MTLTSQRLFKRSRSAVAAVALSAFVAGCGSDDGPEIVPVAGVVHNAGTPVPNATVTFMPQGGRPSTGTTDKDGRFTLRYTVRKDGAVVGKHDVVIAVGGAMPGPPPGASPDAGRKASPAPPSGPVAPTEYRWPDAVTVTEDSEEFDFDMVQTDFSET